MTNKKKSRSPITLDNGEFAPPPSLSNHHFYIARLLRGTRDIVEGLSKLEKQPLGVVQAHRQLFIEYTQPSADKDPEVVRKAMNRIYSGQPVEKLVTFGHAITTQCEESRLVTIAIPFTSDGRVQDEMFRARKTDEDIAKEDVIAQIVLFRTPDYERAEHIAEVFNNYGPKNAVTTIPFICGIPKVSAVVS